ncbi:MAG: PepSY-like domain-containing protein [Bacteroidales bacterium]|jgi:hypothetical protein
MKKLIASLSACLLIGLMVYTQNIPPDEVPAPVKQTFAKKFPAATSIKYEMGKNDYEVTFKDNGVEMSADFNSSGEWLETETIIKESDLPKEVTASVAKNFAGYQISEVAKVKAKNKGLIYKIDLKTNKVGFEAQFSPKGNVLKSTPLKK